MGLALREKDFRAFVQSHDWQQYTGKHVAIGCSADAIVPTWAYMLVCTQLSPIASSIHFGTIEELENQLFQSMIQHLDLTPYVDGKIVVKGCSKEAVPTDAYVALTNRLRPIARSIFLENLVARFLCIKKLDNPSYFINLRFRFSVCPNNLKNSINLFQRF